MLYRMATRWTALEQRDLPASAAYPAPAPAVETTRAETTASPPAIPSARSIDIPQFLKAQAIADATWNAVQQLNAEHRKRLLELARTNPNGSAPESQALVEKLEQERRGAVGKLLSYDQVRSYEEMRSFQIDGVVSLAGGKVVHYTYRY